MSSPYPTIKHFYNPIATPSKKNTPSDRPLPPQQPPSSHSLTPISSSQWTPLQPYTAVNISNLSPGPRCASFTCRVMNIYDQTIESKMPQSAKGCLKLLVKDDTATLLIKLWYASPTTYALRLGNLLTVWTTHIHSTSTLTGRNDITATATLPAAPIMTSIFPERDTGCHVQIHDEEGKLSACCHSPLSAGNLLHDLLSLDTYLNHNGAEMPDARLLVCVVAVGEPMSVTTQSSRTFMTIDCTISDALTQTTLSLSPPLFLSARSWTRNQTILLLSSPRLRGNRLTLTPRSQVDVDPAISAAAALRRTVQRAHAPTNRVFPSETGEAHLHEMQATGLRLQFTLRSLCQFIDDADADADADADPLSRRPLITGYISTILTQINLTSLIRRKMLFSMPCCGMPVYGNGVGGRCGQCARSVRLRVNPDVVGGLADETGGFAIGVSRARAPPGTAGNPHRHSPLLVGDRAWSQLLGRSPDALAECCREDVSAELRGENAVLLRYLEQRLQWMRVVLCVGWLGEVDGGRLAVLRVVA